MKAFIDLGAYKGDTIEQFFNWGHLLGDPKEFEIHAFEPNPGCHKRLKTIAKQKGNVIVHPEAAWIKNGEVDLMVEGIGSTIMRSKKGWNDHKVIKVPSVQFSYWLWAEYADTWDFTVLKMDIEGAEFEVLEEMLKTNTINAIDHLWVEFHQNKVTDYTTQYKNELVDRIKKIVPNFWEWH